MSAANSSQALRKRLYGGLQEMSLHWIEFLNRMDFVIWYSCNDLPMEDLPTLSLLLTLSHEH